VPTKLIVICPVYNEQLALPLFFDRISKVKATIAQKCDLNLVIVDNCSEDQTKNIAKKLCEANNWVSYIRLSRNNGYQRSLECGLRSSIGDIYVMIDVDCEDPPEMIPQFLAEKENGFQVIYGERVDRDEPIFLKWMRKQYYHMTKMAADEGFNLYMAEFSMITREVRDALIRDSNSFPFFRASIARVGFRQKGIPYKRQPRVQGQTHYNFWGLVKFGLAGLFTSSTLFLRATAFAFLPWFAILTALFAAGVIQDDARYFWGAIWLGFGYMGAGLGGLSIYLARTYKNTLNRPNYFVDVKDSVLKEFVEVQS
jgi:glycosyltransferase involved in cell wall biosynthesis